MITSLSKDDRDRLLGSYNEAIKSYKQAATQFDLKPDDGESHDSNDDFMENQLVAARKAELGYYDALERTPVAKCPFCDRVLRRTIDPFDFKGHWWRSDATPPEAPSCPHFCCLAGAVNFNGIEPRAGDFEVHSGPEVPYVIPRLLEYKGVVAVISQIEMENGYTAYPTAYFAKRRPQPELLTADWARTIFVYTTQLGISGWRIPNDEWDFELRPWLEAGKVRWCEPGSDNTVLSRNSPDSCPYLDLPGKQQRIVVKGNSSWSIGLPSGEPLFSIV